MKKLTIIFIVALFVFTTACGNSMQSTEASVTTEITVSDLEFADVETYNIETPILTLKYPTKWETKVQTDIDDNGVKFSSDGVELFDILFKTVDGASLIGTYNGIDIFVLVKQNAQTDEQIAMQNDVNVIIENIENDPNFTK